jgi:hypothetical protein
MPQDVETQAGQLREKSEPRPSQAIPEQVLIILEGEKLRGHNPGRFFRRTAFHVGLHKTSKPRSCQSNSMGVPKELEQWQPSGNDYGKIHGT